LVNVKQWAVELRAQFPSATGVDSIADSDFVDDARPAAKPCPASGEWPQP
jgi:hypothetical protein